MDADQWDLYAVVRSFTAAAAAADDPTATMDSLLSTILTPTVIEDQLTYFVDGSYDLPGSWETTGTAAADYYHSNPFDELGKLYKPFIPPAAADDQSSSSSELGGFKQLGNQAILIQQQQQQQHQNLFQRKHELQQLKQYDIDHHHYHHHHLHPDQLPPQPHYRCRKRKNDQKRTTCQVTAENILATDKWAWRKYGQKPIKGSPYPRNYYRCSSSKGCAARKQVERSPTVSNVFIVTYTGDHCHARPTHRNSLAGSTRTKFSIPNNNQVQHPHNPAEPSLSASAAAASGPKPVSSPSSSSSSSLPPTTPLPATMEERDVKPTVMINTEEEYLGSFEDGLVKLVDMVAVGGGVNDDELYGFDDILVPNRIVDAEDVLG